ncbi:lysine exporter protein LysE/YggA [Alcanivorax hongdengensis A-11-3]|uniref:Lysine exporter protein LysE/YggA n=1 Tax=Alcanivorax hongdengensis A-11-3 TaxID=1177179 RepID=L0WCU4_9GAMM|nr:LysE family translocator [Alcanivorax hongdengensis]EKF73565.1 lysine exporter protein LysE/YggA [Alcanivorax hongdengensis A-11-3]
MQTESLLPLFGFVAVMTGTPGPNNLMLMASGANAGFRRSLGHIFGILVGCQVMLLCVALGLGQLLARYPQALNSLRIAGALYLLYLAAQLLRSRRLDSEPTARPPLGFLQAALFQWVNPKAWMMIVTGVATFADPAHFSLSVMLVAGSFFLLGLPLISSWNLFGVALKQWLQQGQRLATFNRVMAALLVLSLYPTFFIAPARADDAASAPSSDVTPPAPDRQRPQWWTSVL